MANERENIRNRNDDSVFFLGSHEETLNQSGAGVGEGFITVTAGISILGHTARRLLCQGVRAFDSDKPVLPVRSAARLLNFLPAPIVGVAHFPQLVGKQSIARPLVPISCISDVPSTLPPDPIWREALNKALSTTDPPTKTRSFAAYSRHKMGTESTGALPKMLEMPTGNEQNTIEDRKIQVRNDTNRARGLANTFTVLDMREKDTRIANIKKEADMARTWNDTLPVAVVRENAQYAAQGAKGAPPIYKPDLQQEKVEETGWQVVHRRNSKKPAGSTSHGLKQAKQGACGQRSKTAPRLQSNNANLKGGAAALLPQPSGKVISSQSPTIFVNETPENVWIKRMAPTVPEVQVKERVDNGGDKTPDEGLPGNSAPLDKIEAMEELEEILRQIRQLVVVTGRMIKKEKLVAKRGQDPPWAGPRR